jgi:hypothetical protein
MLEFHDSFPDKKRAFVLREKINVKFLSSLKHLFEVCQDGGINTKYELEVLSKIDCKEKISGMLHVIHDRLYKSISQKSVSNIESVLKEFGDLEYKAMPVRLISWSDNHYSIPMYKLYYDASNDGFINTYGVPFDGSALTETMYKQSSKQVIKALEKIKTITPIIYQELDVLVSDIMLIHSPTMNAASSISALGIFRMSQIKENQNWTRYFENIIHEAAHQYLNYLWFLDPIILNEGDRLFSSPLRKEKRPLSGIFHALFVLARTMYGIKTLKNNKSYNPQSDRVETAYNNAGNDASFEEKFNDCWLLIKENAELTEIGENLLLSSRKLAFS